MNILIVGTGMYVCGRGTDGFGTIMPAVYEWKKSNPHGEIYLAGTNAGGLKTAQEKLRQLQQNMNLQVSLKYFPEGSENDARSYKEAMRAIPRPACALIAVPDNLHKTIAGEAIKNRMHTLVVKPLAPTLEEVNELIALQKEQGVYCAVEFHKRLDYANLRLRDMVTSGRLGDLLYMIVEYSQRKSMPARQFRKWVQATNIFQYLGIHYVDIIYFTTRAIPKRVMAMGQKGWLSAQGIDTCDSVQGIIEWEMPSGKRFTSCILTNWIDPERTSAMSDQKIKVVGTKGNFESNQKKRGLTIVTDENGIEQPNPYFCSAYGPEGSISYRGYGIASIHQFLDDALKVESRIVGIDELERKRPTFRASVVPTAVLEAVNKSLNRNNEWITIQGI